MKKSVFITRELSPKSSFHKQLEAAEFEVTGRSLLTFRQVPFSAFPTTEWIFFYSRKAVEFFLAQLQYLPTDFKIAAYGPGTAEALRNHKITPNFIGTGEGASTLTAFLKIADNQSVLFPQAVRSRRTIEKLAGNQLTCFPLVVYDNLVREVVEKRSDRFLVFTSPLNVTAYFEHHQLEENQKVIVMGKTTGAALARYGIENFKVAETASEEGLAAAVLLC